MKVRINKEVEIDAEVDVDSDDVLDMFGVNTDESAADFKYRWLASMDTMTKIMARAKDEVIAAVKPEARAEIHRRLMVEAARYLGKGD